MSALTSTSSSSTPSPTHPSASKKGAKGKDSKLQLFLGGSCNPTTWRQNVAIPFLETKGISYYNPQVDDWTPEVVNLELCAKQDAQILLFVIDRQTRSTVSLVESAFIAGDSKNLVVVIYPFECNVICLQDTSTQTSNLIETSSKLMTTSLFVNKNQVDTSSFIRSSSSTSTTSSTLVSSSNTQDSIPGSRTTYASTSTTTTTNSTSTKSRSAVLRNKCDLDRSNLEEIYEQAKLASSTIRINDEVVSMSDFQELKQARYMLQNLVVIQNIPMFSDILQALKYVSCSLGESTESFDQSICCKGSLELNEDQDSKTNPTLSNSVTSYMNQKSCFTGIGDKNILKDVYLSLDSDDHSSIETSVIAMLDEIGLTYNYMFMNNFTKSRSAHVNVSPAVGLQKLSINSQRPTIANELARCTGTTPSNLEITKLAIEQEISAIKSSRVLLFVITNRCRGLSIMVLASHFMALFRDNVVLCVQYLEEPCSIGGEILSKSAIADYNRGRVYLRDYAIKSHVPVFSTIREAIECCSRKCRYNNKI